MKILLHCFPDHFIENLTSLTYIQKTLKYDYVNLLHSCCTELKNKLVKGRFTQ